MSSNPIKRLSVKEYFEIEKKSGIKHEYVYGDIFSMTGASRNHCRIATSIAKRLDQQLESTDCETFIADMRTKIDDQHYYYPDVAVACTPEFETFGGLDTLTNPILVVEILSASTARFDRNTKFEDYQQIDSLVYYLLVSQNEVNAILFIRQQDSSWTSQTFNNLDTFIELANITCRLALRDIYLRVRF